MKNLSRGKILSENYCCNSVAVPGCSNVITLLVPYSVLDGAHLNSVQYYITVSWLSWKEICLVFTSLQWITTVLCQPLIVGMEGAMWTCGECRGIFTESR